MKLIDGDELIELLLSTAITDKQMEYSECVQYAVQKMPTVDAVPVRCKDCKWWRDTDHSCKEHSLVSPLRAEVFCSRGERKDGEAHD